MMHHHDTTSLGTCRYRHRDIYYWNSMDAVLDITHLSKQFGSMKAVDDVSFSIMNGEIFGFLGPNGAGKTTTIRMIMDFLRPTSGTVTLFGLNAITDGVDIRRRIGYMPAVTSLNERWTGADHIAYARALRKLPDSADELVQRLELDAIKTVKQLSTGNRQKLSLVLAFMFKSDFIILDEPTNGLDPLLQQTVYEMIDEAHARGATIFMSSHNLTEVEKVCTRVGVLRQGALIAQEAIASLQDKHLYKVTLQFERDVTAADFDLPNAKVIDIRARHVQLTYTGDVQPLLNFVTKMKVHDATIDHASLEEHFMEFYDRGGSR